MIPAGLVWTRGLKISTGIAYAEPIPAIAEPPAAAILQYIGTGCTERNKLGQTLVDLGAPRDGVLLAAALLVPFITWSIMKRLRRARGVLSRYPWGGAVVDLILFPTAAYGFGVLVIHLFSSFDLFGAVGPARQITQLLIFLSVASGCARIAEIWLVAQDQSKLRGKLSQMARSVLHGLFLFVGLIVFLIVNDYSPTKIYVSTGAAAALVAIVTQQTLGDFFSGVALSVERPFNIGDWLRFTDGEEGQVTDINWRATHLKKWDNTTFVVPNSQLARLSFTNLHGPSHVYAPWYHIQISEKVDPNEVNECLLRAAKRCISVLSEPGPVARLVDGTRPPYTYMVWVHFENYPAMFAGREELYREIHQALQSNGISAAAEIYEVRYNSPGGLPGPVQSSCKLS